MIDRLARTLAAARVRVADDRGHVGVLMAFVIFVVVGALTMTWNTAQLSKEKMRLQNAADSAALGFCVWQARGMNTVQNLNDEMYAALSIAKKLLVVAVPAETAAQALDKMGNIPYIGIVCKIAAQAFHIVAAISGGLSGLLANRICPYFLKPLGYFYAYGSTVLAYWGAQQLAAKNRADPLGNVSISLGPLGTLGVYALGLAFPLVDTVKLPLQPESKSEEPWKNDTDNSDLFQKKSGGIYQTIHKICGTGGKWEVKPWVSKRDDKTGKDALPGPSIWVAHKYYSHVEAMPLEAWTTNAVAVIDKWPMVAIAAAQCVTGDVVAHSVTPAKAKGSQRPAGFGTGATAKLIPVTTAFAALTTNGISTAVLKRIIYH